MPETASSQPANARPAHSPLRAAAWMLGALTSFSTLAISAREVSAEIDTFELMFFRSLISLGVVLLLVSLSPQGVRQFRTTKFKLHLFRNSIHFVGQFCWFYAIALIPLSHVFALEFTSPIWVALLAPLVLAERFSWRRLAGVFLGFVGILLVVRPGEGALNLGTGAALLAAVSFAGSILATKGLTRTDSALTILFYMALLQLPMGLLPALGSLHFPSLATWGWLVVVTFCGLSAHFCMARAFAQADATVVAPMDFLRLPLIAVLGLLLYGEPLEVWVMVGGLVIICGNLLGLSGERRRPLTRPALDPSRDL